MGALRPRGGRSKEKGSRDVGGRLDQKKPQSTGDTRTPKKISGDNKSGEESDKDFPSPARPLLIFFLLGKERTEEGKPCGEEAP